LKAARAAAAKASLKSRAVTFTALEKYRVVGEFNDKMMLTRVRTHIENPVLGDMLITTIYSDYRDFEGVKFPAKIAQEQGGYPLLDVSVTSVQPNAPADLLVPEPILAAKQPAVRVETNKLADNVWRIAGGSQHSILVEFKDFCVMVEAPEHDARSLAVLAEARKLLPDKPIKYVVNTHLHFDHSGGLRTYVAEGATVVTYHRNQAFYERSFRAPATLAPGALAQRRRKATFVGVKQEYLFTDGKQKLVIYALQNDPHYDGMLMAYLPNSKVLIEADIFSAPRPGAIRPPKPPAAALNLYRNIQRLHLDVERFAAIHGRVASMAEFLDFTQMH
jgi:glyoxylase-like metal-dependent hydrolase (beta-lactamase superfamily II)